MGPEYYLYTYILMISDGVYDYILLLFLSKQGWCLLCDVWWTRGQKKSPVFSLVFFLL